ncbi:MAG: YgjP-like metallopeptidase domain-containing protein [Sagittula sp.]
MNHSDRFWAEVERLYGDWRAPRKWLRDHGNELHRYRFD